MTKSNFKKEDKREKNAEKKNWLYIFLDKVQTFSSRSRYFLFRFSELSFFPFNLFFFSPSFSAFGFSLLFFSFFFLSLQLEHEARFDSEVLVLTEFNVTT